MREQEGFIPVVGEYRIWYRMVGGGAERENIPLLALHGGPGVPHDYIENLGALASEHPPGHFLRSARVRAFRPTRRHLALACRSLCRGTRHRAP